MIFLKALLPGFLWLMAGLQPVVYSDVVEDTAAGYDAVTGRYTIPASGLYQVHAVLYPETADHYPTFASLQVYRQGQASAVFARPALLHQEWGGSFAGQAVEVLVTERFEAGQVVYPMLFLHGGRVQFAGPQYESRLTIIRLGE